MWPKHFNFEWLITHVFFKVRAYQTILRRSSVFASQLDSSDEVSSEDMASHSAELLSIALIERLPNASIVDMSARHYLPLRTSNYPTSMERHP